MPSQNVLKYQKIEEDILDAIKSGTLQPGEKVPSQSELMAKYSVSAITIRKAFSELINEGYLVGIQGSGTFVAKKQMIRSLTSISFAEELKEQGYRPDQEIESIEKIVSPRVAEIIGVPDDTFFTKISRVRFANDEPVAYHTSWLLNYQINEKQAQLIHKTKSLYKMMKKYGLVPYFVNENYSVHEIEDPEIFRKLKVKKNYPCFFVKRTTFDEQNNIIEYAETCFNKDFYSVTVNIRK